MAAQRPNQEAFDRALTYFDEARKTHSDFVDKVERRYKAYRGILDELSDAGQWRSQLAPPYIQHIVETTLSSEIEDRLKFKIRPRGLMLDGPERLLAADGAKAHQILMDWQLRRDRLTDIQRPFGLQNKIAGMTVAKTYWTEQIQTRRRLVQHDNQVLGPDGRPLINHLTGQPVTVPSFEEEEYEALVYDGPTTEVVDVRDFLWHEAATSIDKARYVIHRVWMDFEDILAAYEDGDFGPEMGGWDEKEIRSLLGESRDFKDEYAYREQELWAIDRSKDKVEVIEIWDQVRNETTTIANRKALLAHRDYPFWHAEAPFVVCSTQPDLFRIPGISQVEKIAALQEMLWTLQNQRLDNLQLINNAIFFFRPDIEDEEEYPFEPGARWFVEDPTQVNMWQPNVIPAEVSLGAEGLFKGDLQNLAGGFPFSSGTDSQVVDQKTATGASIVTSIAQRSINLAKQQLYAAYSRIGYQRMVLNQQFIREPTLAPVLGLDDQDEVEVIYPMILQGDYDFELEPASDALMKQEDQASSQALVQIGASLAPILVPMAQAGVGKMIRLDILFEELLKAAGKDDIERYFTQAVPAMPQASGAPGGPGGGAPATPESGAPAGPGQGVTSGAATNAATSPSSEVSVSPSVIMQRAMAAANGGGTNV